MFVTRTRKMLFATTVWGIVATSQLVLENVVAAAVFACGTVAFAIGTVLVHRDEHPPTR